MSEYKLSDTHNQILEIDLALDTEIPTTLWISDLHGEGKRFVSILRGRFGLVYRTCKEALPQTLGEKHINYLSRVIRKKMYIADPDIKLDKQDVVLSLIEVLKYKLRKRYRLLDEVPNQNIRKVIAQLLLDEMAPDIVFEEDLFLDTLIHEICILIMRYLLDHLVVLGDIMDRGGEPDKIIRILDSKRIQQNMTLIFGNHDLLWMGACAGSRSLIAEALRITFRYDHMAFLERMELDFSKLKAFALKTYPPGSITGKYKAKTTEARSMEKALSIIQFKLEEQTIKKFPELEMSHRLQLERLADCLKRKQYEGITDTNLPTLELADPLRLSAEEQEVIDDLTHQFLNNKQLKYYVGFFFRKGKMYHVNNNILNIHALIPSTEDGQFETLFGKKGIELFDYIDALIHKIGEAFLDGKSSAEYDLAVLFYLWCGPKSPLFGKDAMKTFERYFYSDKDTHKESTLYWEKNILKPEFQKRIQDEFSAKRVVYGHVPRNISKGQKMACSDGFAINIDGGFAAAYYNRGHALVHTPSQLYGIILPGPEELEEAYKNRVSASIRIEIITDYMRPQKIKDTVYGDLLKENRRQLIKKLHSLSSLT